MSEIVLLDGSVGQELVKRSTQAPTPLWSTQVMIDQPDLLGAVHRDYFAAGATVATANTYAIHRSRLERVGLDDRLADLISAALDQAEAARASAGGGRIAGAMGPVLATYRPDLTPDVEDAAQKFREIATLMWDRVDLFVLETVSSLQEAEGALRGVTGLNRPVWLALSVMDEDGTHLRSGEPVGATAALIERYAPDAVLINCSRPEAIGAALDIVADFDRPFGAYANGFTRITEGFLADAPTVDALEERTDLGPEAYADIAMGWVAQGATIVGGCCEVGPAHIAELARRLRADHHRIV
ncbi:homocysteine S-methyltransferase family protein [Thalassococcus sp. S3]|uniref:homocysteine S-methyltransferase family protein n=1 Tax=Thalassococcus sp. S3 TaxID=2017482 RepID=UPI0010242D5E|nr:homocysteine S-methyltransferase family protein [Thalassococcus sp. S3]QBF33766.1 homocysteine S-methyltransferase [Thalassococcus sp. S3]